MEATVVGQPPESFSPLNQVTLPIGDGQLNGSANLPTGFILWSNRQDMFKLTGLLTDNTVSNQFQLGATIQRLPYKIGCGSPYATIIFFTRHVLAFFRPASVALYRPLRPEECGHSDSRHFEPASTELVWLRQR